MIKGKIATTFVVLKMTKFIKSNEIEVNLMVGEEERIYRLKFERIGATVPGELQNLMTQRTKRSQDFIDSAFKFYKGESIKFPLDLSYL